MTSTKQPRVFDTQVVGAVATVKGERMEGELRVKLLHVWRARRKALLFLILELRRVGAPLNGLELDESKDWDRFDDPATMERVIQWRDSTK